ncbi:MAG: TraB/GumN family protein [Alphaproteobacteria bacterium]
MPRIRLFLAGLCTALAALALAAPASAAAADYALYGDTLLWRLDPPGGGAPSYAVGTIHMVDPVLEPSLQRARDRLREAGALIVETDVSDAAQLDVVAAMILTDGRALPDLIGKEAFDRLAAIAEDYGLPGIFLRTLAPWGAALMISVPAEQMQRMAAGDAVFDQALIDSAQAWGLPVETLESIDEQIDAFAGHSEADQITMLLHAIEVHDQLDAMVEAMLARYVAGDLAGLAELALVEMSAGDETLDARVLDALITDRNRRMAERMLPLLAQHPHLVAIGAMHLPGEEGVLNLLAQQGWKISPAR